MLISEEEFFIKKHYNFQSQINLVICDSKNHIIPEKYDNYHQLAAIASKIDELFSFTQFGTKIVANSSIEMGKFYQQAETKKLSFSYNINFICNTERKHKTVLKYIKQFLKTINNKKLWSFIKSDDINKEVYTYKLQSQHNNIITLTSSSYWNYIQSQHDPYNIDCYYGNC